MAASLFQFAGLCLPCPAVLCQEAAQQQPSGSAALRRTDQQAAEMERMWLLIDAAATSRGMLSSCADAWPTGVRAAGAALFKVVVACVLVWRQQTAAVPMLIMRAPTLHRCLWPAGCGCS